MSDETSKVSDLEAKLNKALDSIEKLEAKNRDLISEKQAAKEAAEAAQAEREAAEEDKARSTNDLEALEARLNAKHQRELKKLQDQLDSKDQTISEANKRLEGYLTDNVIKDAMAKHGVMPHLQRAFTAMIKAETKIVDGEALAGDIPLSDYLTDFVSSDEGKAFIAAPKNGGAATNAPANPSHGKAHDFTKDNIKSRLGEFLMINKSDPELGARIQNDTGYKL